MAESALIEVFGPLADVERALLDMPELTGERRNRADALVLDAEHVSIVVGDNGPTFVHVHGTGSDLMTGAGEVYRGLATRVTFPMRLFDEADEIVQVRGAVPAE